MPTVQRSNKDLHKSQSRSSQGGSSAGAAWQSPGLRGLRHTLPQLLPGSLTAASVSSSAAKTRRYIAPACTSPTLLAAQTGRHTAASNGAHARPGARRSRACLSRLSPSCMQPATLCAPPLPRAPQRRYRNASAPLVAVCKRITLCTRALGGGLLNICARAHLVKPQSACTWKAQQSASKAGSPARKSSSVTSCAAQGWPPQTP